MLVIDALYLFLAKVAAVAAAEWYFITRLFAERVPSWLLSHAVAVSFTTSLAAFLTYNFFIYPTFLSPLRVLPAVHARSFQIILESPRGKTPLQWMIDHPDADLLRVAGGAATVVVPTSAQALRDILNTRTYDFEKPWGVRTFLARIIGFGLILSEGAAHKKQKKALTPAFNIKKIRDLYGLMWEKTGILLQELKRDIKENPIEKGWGKVEMAEWGSRLTLDIIGPTAIGRDFQSLTIEENRVAKAFLEILDPSRERLIFLGLQTVFHSWFVRRLPIAVNEMLDRNEAFLRGLCMDIVQETKAKLQKNSKANDYEILSMIIKTGEFSDHEVVDQMLTFLAAGHETTASALTWTTYLLANNPAVQARLREEIRANIPSSSSPITWDLLESLPYLNGVCEETLRLYPTVPTTVRESIRETCVAGITIPKDTFFLLVPYAINRNPAFWGPKANDIIPERWIDTLPDGTQRPNKHGGASTNFAEITFLHGPRACIGRDFAKAELRCAVAGVIGKFEMEMERPDEEILVTGVVTTKPEGGMHLKMREVEGW